ncbi:nucleotidyltransferase family protein [Rothia nasimurium]|uniref:nucleotidyltransferase family protein n=1 Tax=Rothia nasimurium TaxID=85336 RepID=UPI00162978C1|nr:nucleotidyltransferase family protein [Rothia nasimurium]
MTDTPTQVQDVPLPIRIQLSHAYFQHLANRLRVDVLHVKGYAFADDVYRPGRSSTDVDLLVRPEHLDRFIEGALADGWRVLTHFETGSIFEHAMTLYHGSWGLVDIHRYFPGIGDAQGSAFETLWQQRRTREIAHYPCYLPSLTDSRIFVVVHGARSENEYNADIEYLRKTLSPAEWQEMRDRLPALGAELAFAAALHELDGFTDHPDYLLWKSVSEKTSTYIRWKARFMHAKGFRAKMRVVFSIVLVNKDHLAMELGHPPTKEEVRQKFFSRFLFWKKKS